MSRARGQKESFPDYRERLRTEDKALKLARHRPVFLFVSTVLGAPRGSGRIAVRRVPKINARRNFA